MPIKRIKSDNLNEMLQAYFSESCEPVKDFVLREKYTSETIKKALIEGYIQKDEKDGELVYYITPAGKEIRG